MFVDAKLEGVKSDRHIQMGVFIFMNKDHIHWYSNSQVTVEASDFWFELCFVNTFVDIVEALCYKLILFVVLINGSDKLFWYNKSVYKNTITPDYFFNNKHHYIAYHSCIY